MVSARVSIRHSRFCLPASIWFAAEICREYGFFPPDRLSKGTLIAMSGRHLCFTHARLACTLLSKYNKPNISSDCLFFASVKCQGCQHCGRIQPSKGVEQRSKRLRTSKRNIRSTPVQSITQVPHLRKWERGGNVYLLSRQENICNASVPLFYNIMPT